MKRIKKLLLIASVAMLMFTAAACSKKQEENVPGSWQTVEDGTITEELQELFDKAMEEQVGVNYKPIELLETQIVSGTNYKFLCESTVTAPDAETTKAIVTIYKDLEGNAKILDIQESESENTQIPNPFVTVDTLQEAEKGAGFAFDVPETVEGYTGKEISYIENSMIQVIFGDENHNLYIRKAVGNEDISGDYSEYAKVKEISVGEQNVTVKGNDDGIHTVIWNNGDHAYALIASDGLTQELVETLLAEIK